MESATGEFALFIGGENLNGYAVDYLLTPFVSVAYCKFSSVLANQHQSSNKVLCLDILWLKRGFTSHLFSGSRLYLDTLKLGRNKIRTKTNKKKKQRLKFKVNVSIATRVATKKERYMTKITDKELALIRNLQSNMKFHNRYTSLKHSWAEMLDYHHGLIGNQLHSLE